jgi:hypothetical protein
MLVTDLWHAYVLTQGLHISAVDLLVMLAALFVTVISKMGNIIMPCWFDYVQLYISFTPKGVVVVCQYV